MSSHLIGTASRVAASAFAGFALVASAAVPLLRLSHGGVGLQQLAGPVSTALVYVCVLPLAGWVVLQILTVRPAWVVALLGQALLIPVLLAFNQPGGFHRPPWQYGLQGALAYGLSAAVVIAIGAVVRQRPDAGQ